MWRCQGQIESQHVASVLLTFELVFNPFFLLFISLINLYSSYLIFNLYLIAQTFPTFEYYFNLSFPLFWNISPLPRLLPLKYSIIDFLSKLHLFHFFLRENFFWEIRLSWELEFVYLIFWEFYFSYF